MWSDKKRDNREDGTQTKTDSQTQEKGCGKFSCMDHSNAVTN